MGGKIETTPPPRIAYGDPTLPTASRGEGKNNNDEPQEKRRGLSPAAPKLFVGMMRGYASLITASSYLPDPMPVSAKMPWSAIHLKVSS